MSLSVIGLGKLGLPMATYFASRGNEVIGLDYNHKLVEQISRGECPYYEAQLPELMAQVNSQLKVTTDYSEAISGSDMTFVIVPTPSGKDHRFSNMYIESACKGIAEELKVKNTYHLVAITSTVMPGTMETVVKPILEGISGKECGKDFGLCYNPEFIALGSVIKNLALPDAILIGESDEMAGTMLAHFYDRTCEKDVSVHRMSWYNAEVAKLMLNVYVTTKISLANTFAEVCEKIPKGDIDKISNFLGADSRIGRKFLNGGLGFGGTCFPRDNRAFISMAKELKVRHPIQDAVIKSNNKHNYNVASRIISTIVQNENILMSSRIVSLLGTTYKPDTNVTEESAALDIAKTIRHFAFKVKTYDPSGAGDCSSIEECLKDSCLCVIATPWAEFKKLEPALLHRHMSVSAILDCWRILDREKFRKASVLYYAVGVNSD